MSYIKAEDVLPRDIIEIIQKYIDGQNIYIPKKSDTRTKWGERTDTLSVLSEKSIQRIIYQAKTKSKS